ncbi:MAG: hypothetical protein N3F07_02280 [Candidatus Micrarchaeota archaeon]|nr:hypothetical protein [Candidatus Micrarchaeota archaeon]
MRAGLAFAALLCFAGFGFAGLLEDFMAKSFEPGMEVEAKQIASGSHYIIILDGKEAYLFDNSEGKPVYDRKRIIGILEEGEKKAAGYEDKKKLAMSLPAAINAAKNKTEAQCMLLTGTDMHECKDKQTCVLACMSNPNCATPLYSDGFWEALLDWSSARKRYAELLAKYQEGLEDALGKPEAIDEKTAIVSELQKIAQNISQNPLFLNRTDEGCSGAKVARRCYEYCPKIDYSASRLQEGKKSLEAIKEILLSAQKQAERADAILSQSAKHDEYLARRMKDFAELRVKLANSVRKANMTSKELALKVKDEEVAPALKDLENYTAKVIEAGDSGRYRQAFRMAEEQQRKYDELSRKMQAGLEKHQQAIERIDKASEKIKKSSWLLGNETSSEQLAKLEAMRQELLSAPATLQKIAELDAKAAQIENEVNLAISQKATEIASGNESLPPEALKEVASRQLAKGGGLPCLPAIALAAVALVAFASRKD